MATAAAAAMGESTDSSYVNVEAQQRPDNEEVAPLEGYAWSKRRGYFELPPDAMEDPQGERVRHHNSGSWKHILGEGMWNTGSEPSEDAWSSKSYDREKTTYSKKRDGDIPEWDGKSEHRTTYFRRIDLWAATTGVDPEDRGCRLLQKLKGEAFEKLENVDPMTLKVQESIERFKEHIVEVYEPIEDYRIGKIMDTFLDDFQRKND